MRWAGIALGLACASALATGAAAQGLGYSTGKRGNEEQQSSGYSDVKKKQEKRFPLGMSWIAVSLNGKPYGGRERPGFTLDESFRVRGFGGCNSFSASAFPLRDQGFAMGPLALTRASCDKDVMALEQAFLVALRTSAKWDSQVGTLFIRGPNGELKFERSL